jgi:hemolysin activation/secretion protein
LSAISRLVCTSSVLILLAISDYSYAGAAAGAVDERARKSREFVEEQKRLKELRERETIPEVIDKTGTDVLKKKLPESDKTFLLTDIIVNPSDILTDEEITTIINPYKNQTVRFQDLNNIIEAFDKLYKERQYVGKAVLPPQKIDKGKIRIQLVESRVADIEVIGNDSTNESFLYKNLDIEIGELVNLGELQDELVYFNNVHDVSVSASLKPGKEPETTDYHLEVFEPKKHSGTLVVDNLGTNDIGRNRIGFNYINRSVFGNRENLSLGGNYADGSNSLYADYNFLMGTKGSRLGIYTSYSDIEINSGPLRSLDVTGESYTISPSLTHPVYVRNDSVVNAFMSYDIKRSTTDFFDVTLFESKVRQINLGLNAYKSLERGIWYGNIQLSNSMEGLGSDEDFINISASLTRTHIFENNWIFSFRSAGQYSDSELLPSLEQFQIGGLYTVRGYKEGLLLGDDGYFVNTEISIPIPMDGEKNISDQSRFIAFFDHGGAFPFKGNNQSIDSDDFLTSVGIGLDLKLFNKVSAKFMVGVPLHSREDGNDSASGHFYIEAYAF